MQNDAAEDDGHNAIEQCAYQLWERRGRPFDSPEEDWFRAEQELQRWASAPTLPFSAR